MRSARLGLIAWRDADHQAAAGEDLRQSTTSSSSCAPGGPCLQYRLRLVVQFPVLTVRGADVDALMLSVVLVSSILRERTDP